jgi:hypothetical protein
MRRRKGVACNFKVFLYLSILTCRRGRNGGHGASSVEKGHRGGLDVGVATQQRGLGRTSLQGSSATTKNDDDCTTLSSSMAGLSKGVGELR